MTTTQSMPITLPTLSTLLGLVSLLCLAPAQAVMPDRDAVILVESNPPGATIQIMGKSWGTTPTQLELKKAFPSLYRPEQPYIGMAVYFRKEGCADQRYPLHRRNIPAQIEVTLDCEAATADPAATSTTVPVLPATTAASQPAPATPMAPASAPAVPAPMVTMPPKATEEPAIQFSSIRKKLEELEQLKDDGLITEQEYHRLRKRVLGYF